MALDVDGCAAMMRALVPGLAVDEVELGDVRAGVAWLDSADPLVRARVAEAAALVSGEPLELPFATEIQPLFMREVGDVHRELYPEHAELYGENVSPKIERCIAVTDGEAAAATSARDAYRERMSAAFEQFDVVLTPTLAVVAPPADIDEIAAREVLIRFTFPFNALGWPALALPCGPAEDGLPASVQLVGKPGTDPLVLGIAEALERALKT
jgi:Asp-tRNA(Asn)/Glu-tRNA(Gln) amidotransferase A subunit family amidase